LFYPKKVLHSFSGPKIIIIKTKKKPSEKCTQFPYKIAVGHFKTTFLGRGEFVEGKEKWEGRNK